MLYKELEVLTVRQYFSNIVMAMWTIPLTNPNKYYQIVLGNVQQL